MADVTNTNIGRVFTLVEHSAAGISKKLEQLAEVIASKDTADEADQILIQLISAINEQAKAMMATQASIKDELLVGQQATQAALDVLKKEMAKLGKENAKTQDLLRQMLGVLQSPKILKFDDQGNPVAVVPEFS